MGEESRVPLQDSEPRQKGLKDNRQLQGIGELTWIPKMTLSRGLQHPGFSLAIGISLFSSQSKLVTHTPTHGKPVYQSYYFKLAWLSWVIISRCCNQASLLRQKLAAA